MACKEETSNCSSTEKDKEFDEIVGEIEDIIIGETFERLQKAFMETNCHHFDENEENKLEYTPLFHEYQNLLEKYIEKELQSRLPHFSMNRFLEQFTTRKRNLEGDVFEVLLTFSDFLEFKSLMLDYKKSKEVPGLDLSDSIVVTSLSSLKIVET